VSESTKRDLLRLTTLAADDLDIVYEARGHTDAVLSTEEASDAREVLARLGIDRLPYVLMVGTLEPRKNHVRVIHAFESLAGRFPELQLVLAGAWGWRSQPIRRAIGSSPVA